MSFWNVFWIQTDQNECERAQNVTRKALFNGIKKVIWNLSVARFRLADFKTAVQNGIPRLGSYGWIRAFSGYQMTFLKCFQSFLTSGKVRIVPNQSKTTISGPSIEHPTINRRLRSKNYQISCNKHEYSAQNTHKNV